ncbi:HSCARG dehydrogenase [Bisporella sp. PMI_857]|nr:HSCARG dehydrogenase [Bisporella sp. PMI_857]
MAKPIFTVVGATGTQGSAVLSAAVSSGIYQVRAVLFSLNRATSMPKAQALKEKGVEIVYADLDDEASLVEAFKESAAIFALTDFFRPFTAGGPAHALQIEENQGQNLARAASRTPTLKHYIWSTLPDIAALSNGKYAIPHFVAKNAVDKYIKSIPELAAKTTFLWITWFVSNYTYGIFTPFLSKPAGKYVQLSPSPASTPILSIGDISSNLGIFTNAILAHSETTHGKTVLASVEETTVGGLLETWGKATGKATRFIEIKNLEELDALYPNWGKEMGGMMVWWGEIRDGAWKGENVLTKSDLGLDGEKWVGIEAAYRKIDWSGYL